MRTSAKRWTEKLEAAIAAQVGESALNRAKAELGESLCSRALSTGNDDPLPPEEFCSEYRKVFIKHFGVERCKASVIFANLTN